MPITVEENSGMGLSGTDWNRETERVEKEVEMNKSKVRPEKEKKSRVEEDGDSKISGHMERIL